MKQIWQSNDGKAIGSKEDVEAYELKSKNTLADIV